MHSGNLGLSQSLDTIVDAAALLRDEPRVTFVFQGDGGVPGAVGDIDTDRRPAGAPKEVPLGGADCQGAYRRTGIVELHQTDAPAQHDVGLVLVRVEMPVGRNVGVGHQGVEQAVAGMVVARVEVAVLAPARAGGGFGADRVEQRVVDQGNHEYITFTFSGFSQSLSPASRASSSRTRQLSGSGSSAIASPLR